MSTDEELLEREKKIQDRWRRWVKFAIELCSQAAASGLSMTVDNGELVNKMTIRTIEGPDGTLMHLQNTPVNKG